MTIYTEFKPTYLYIKQHSVTGMLYFGKTIKNPEKYLGSGKHWSGHLKKHGKKQVITLWYCLFLDELSITECALMCSRLWGIVDSSEWANLVEENGLGGGAFGHKSYERTEERRLESSAQQKGKKRGPYGPNHGQNISAARLTFFKTPEGIALKAKKSADMVLTWANRKKLKESVLQ